jgi:hypothetical protein
MLNNVIIFHVLIGENSYGKAAKEKSHFFTFYIRYNSENFQRIMFDTGIAGTFIAGEPQVKIL